MHSFPESPAVAPRPSLLADDVVHALPVLVLGATLAMAIAIVHLEDQGGILGNVTPVWMKYGYYLVETVAAISAALLIRGKVLGWVLGLAASIGPMAGYVLSRTVGVPGDTSDIGNWGYMLGTMSLLVEGTFIVFAVISLRRIARQSRVPQVGG